jgi:NAD(P)-dependent dehydrogenase (short-subunit alcohol dehydrogenase family)
VSASASVASRFSLDNRVVIVTGASSGLGVHFAQACAEAGADVVLAARRTDRLVATQAAVDAAGTQALVVPADVSRPEDCTRVVEQAFARFGRVDVLVNNAGVGTAVPALKESVDEFERVVGINLTGTYLMAQAAARVMQPGSSIINISSVLGLTTAGLPQAAYSASKAAVIGLTRDLAQQWGSRLGIRVNAIAPGFFDSEMTNEYPDGYWGRIQPRIVLGGPGDPDDLAATLVWLASPAASYVTGQTIAVDGGFTIT